ncbi:hypothetical protein AB1Y20_012910 [Prymnesium parvum]|uniref:Uncharacterized protein n=1 Tax=Prymnesium parvum TaxID=97485 RepID=A0AB34IKN5_PRYPA
MLRSTPPHDEGKEQEVDSLVVWSLVYSQVAASCYGHDSTLVLAPQSPRRGVDLNYLSALSRRGYSPGASPAAYAPPDCDELADGADGPHYSGDLGQVATPGYHEAAAVVGFELRERAASRVEVAFHRSLTPSARPVVLLLFPPRGVDCLVEQRARLFACAPQRSTHCRGVPDVPRARDGAAPLPVAAAIFRLEANATRAEAMAACEDGTPSPPPSLHSSPPLPPPLPLPSTTPPSPPQLPSPPSATPSPLHHPSLPSTAPLPSLRHSLSPPPLLPPLHCPLPLLRHSHSPPSATPSPLHHPSLPSTSPLPSLRLSHSPPPPPSPPLLCSPHFPFPSPPPLPPLHTRFPLPHPPNHPPLLVAVAAALALVASPSAPAASLSDYPRLIAAIGAAGALALAWGERCDARLSAPPPPRAAIPTRFGWEAAGWRGEVPRAWLSPRASPAPLSRSGARPSPPLYSATPTPPSTPTPSSPLPSSPSPSPQPSPPPHPSPPPSLPVVKPQPPAAPPPAAAVSWEAWLIEQSSRWRGEAAAEAAGLLDGRLAAIQLSAALVGAGGTAVLLGVCSAIRLRLRYYRRVFQDDSVPPCGARSLSPKFAAMPAAVESSDAVHAALNEREGWTVL